MTQETSLAPGAARHIIDLAPCGVMVTDREAVISFVNPRFAMWFQRDEASVTGQRLSGFLDVASRIYFDTHVLPMLYIQGYAREISCHIKRPDGSTLPILLNANMGTNDKTGKEEIIVTALDTTERAMYEADLRRARDDAEELAAVVESARVAIFRTDPEGRLKRWNPASVTMFGFDAATAVGKPLSDLVELETGGDWLGPRMAEAMSLQSAIFFQDTTTDGRHVSISATPILDPKSLKKSTDFSLVVRDVTDQVRADSRVKIMLRELNHRVKNNLAVVSGIARQTFRSPASKEEASRFFSRIQALAAAHDLLVENNWKSANLTQIVDLMSSKSGLQDQFLIEGPEINLPSQSVAMVSLALFELMTNAMKYGALQSGGSVSLTWEIDHADPASPQFVFRWEEITGSEIVPPTKRGFGSRLIEKMVAAELGGSAKLDFTSNGLKYRLQAPYWGDETE